MYFSEFPTIPYDAEGNGKFKDVKNLLRRVGIRAKVKSNTMLYDTYDVKNGETPESIAFKLYDDAELHWVILMTNNITDRYYEWPMNQVQFAEFLKDKYGAGNEDGIHHYEVTQDSGRTSGRGPSDYSHKVEVNSDTDNASSISNREYEERLQDKYRSIKLLNQQFLSDFLEEFDKLIKE